LQVEQSKLKLGIQAKTIFELENLTKVLSEDLSEDQRPRRVAVEHLVGYLATLPGDGHRAVDELKVPAKESHTQMEFGTAIGEVMGDAQGSKVCFYKTGDSWNKR